MARRKHFVEDSENHERWLISYADFITLLFAFFVVMYAVSVVNVGKYKVLSDALGDAFGRHGAASTVNPSASLASPDALPLSNIVAHRRLEAAKRDRERLDLLARKLNSVLAPLVNSGKVRIIQTGRGITVEINASVLFDEGDAALVGNARETLRTVAGLLKDDPHAIEVEGHTDTTPISNAAFPSNWELSAVRASTVVRLFVESGVGESRLAAVGRGANQPLASNADPVGRARNRRVAVTILSGSGSD
ncbi:flagellar motor protein MotD [Massilia sp. WF1]|uniref:flagellar motor protein MotD n=1 Tax=unclassified Massilia TaxID=2609279 RepID=UPI00064B77D7|nr:MULTISPECIES: flagellar motor protein MotD [unclassified Massilia]ALK98546.1 flagellar motor protein MotD [Massilia sp. WG5]KLU35918.1 flagellar motor protein MotD [Massilia sp. WF1]